MGGWPEPGYEHQVPQDSVGGKGRASCPEEEEGIMSS